MSLSLIVLFVYNQPCWYMQQTVKTLQKNELVNEGELSIVIKARIKMHEKCR